MGCAWVRDTGGWDLAVCGTWHITPLLPWSPGQTHGPIPASLRDYPAFTANRCRKTGPETAQQQLAANECSKIIYWTLVLQSIIAALGQLQQPGATKPLYQRNQFVVADGHGCRAGGTLKGSLGRLLVMHQDEEPTSSPGSF